MIVTTKAGDKGYTMLYGAKRVPKHHLLININGQLDKLQAIIGLAKTKITNKKILAELTTTQKNLYQIMSFISGAKALTVENIALQTQELEAWQTWWLTKAKIKSKFVIPGQTEAEALLHFVRTETRTIERQISKYCRLYPRLKRLIPYLNRLSDYFFILSQVLLLK